MLARSRQLQGIFGLIKPLLHGQILVYFVDVSQNDDVLVMPEEIKQQAKLKLKFG